MICQVLGRKQVLLHPPGDAALLYRLPIGASRHYNVSRSDPFTASDGALTPLEGTHPFEAVLEPGDALFIPIHWSHGVRGFGAVMSISLFWNARLREHRFPRPGFHNVAGLARWQPRLLLHRVVESAWEFTSGISLGRREKPR
jgi:hypothetical protein